MENLECELTELTTKLEFLQNYQVRTLRDRDQHSFDS